MRKVGEYYYQAKQLGYTEEHAKAILDKELEASRASLTYTYAQAVETSLRILVNRKIW